MNKSRLVKISKYLSMVLRHKPERIGLKLAPGGWVSVEDLLSGCARNRFSLTRAELDEVVAKNDKKRFSFDQTATIIRANQGHSLEIDLQLKPTLPPDVLYHGTRRGAVESILETGLCKMSRHHVHLSAEIATAKIVGKRKGFPVVFAINTAQMQSEGFLFYCSENLVWLVEKVPPEYLQLI